MWSDTCDYLNKEEKAKNTQGETNSSPPDPKCIIKGNISKKDYGRTYLLPGCDNYNTIKIDTKKGEKYFCTEEEVMEAGFRKATNCP